MISYPTGLGANFLSYLRWYLTLPFMTPYHTLDDFSPYLTFHDFLAYLQLEWLMISARSLNFLIWTWYLNTCLDFLWPLIVSLGFSFNKLNILIFTWDFLFLLIFFYLLGCDLLLRISLIHFELIFECLDELNISSFTWMFLADSWRYLTNIFQSIFKWNKVLKWDKVSKVEISKILFSWCQQLSTAHCHTYILNAC